MILYGIPNCDTVKKARTWLDEHQIAYQFHDYKKQGVPAQLQSWIKQVGADSLINRRGTTWRGLSEQVQQEASTTAGALALMQANLSVIKRPVVERNGQIILIGFDAVQWHNALI